MNIDDAIAAIREWQKLGGTPHPSVTDLHPQVINAVINFDDVALVLLQGFTGMPYPYGCPDDPCQVKTVDPCP